MSLFANPLHALEGYDALVRALEKGGGPLRVTGLTDAAKAHFIDAFRPEGRSWKLVVTHDETNARDLMEDLTSFAGNVFLYPSRDLLFFSADIRSHEITRQRIEVLKAMAEDGNGIVVAPAGALMDRMEAPEDFKSSVITIGADGDLDPAALTEALVSFGYERTPEVDGMGQFAIRGGIVDIWPMTEALPVRIELWDTEIDSIRAFDPETQRSTERRSEVRVWPVKQRNRGGRVSFLRYFDADKSVIFLDEPVRVKERLGELEQELSESIAGRLEAGQVSGDEIPEYFTADEIMEELKSPSAVCLSGLDTRLPGFDAGPVLAAGTRSQASCRGAFDLLISQLKTAQANKTRTVLLTPSRTRASRLAEDLRGYGISAFCPDLKEDGSLPEALPGAVMVMTGALKRGFEYPMLKFSVLSENDLFGTGTVRKRKRRAEKARNADAVSSLSELMTGDYVVHEEHGLGIYRGIEKIETDGVIKDYIKIEYRGGDNLYVPATRLDAIQKYAAGDVKAPPLNRLGGSEWARTRKRVRGAVAEIAKELVELYASRLKGQGHAYGPDTVWQKEFEELFPFEETEDQLTAIEEIKRDMEEGRIMDRLICGDVGYGKTEIALRAAFKAVQEGFQVICLVPTTILAEQHYNTFVQRMKDFPVRVDLLCRFRTAAEQRKTLADFERGQVDIIIGTHRVLTKDLKPKKLGLLIVDEEQRFGVKHKERLKELKRDVNVLTLTATPIPRTLHMSLTGIRDLSILKEPPLDRRPIQTYVMEYSDETIREAVRREMSRGGQTYFVVNRVNAAADMAARVRLLVPDAEVAYAHGQMNERELERIMLDFINGEIDVLVSTTIIETGLDIPNANTLIVQDADRLGLSQLYQLRGRVGRSSRTAYAFLLYRRGKQMTEEAEKRLKAIREFTELGSGIRIAMRDLEIRGAGNVLGAEQHGHMQAVGYDLYCKLLNRAVTALRDGREVPEEKELTCSVEAQADAYIPENYVQNEEQRLDLYQRIASVDTEERFMDMQDELIDRFGDLPRPVTNLLWIARLRAEAAKVSVTEILLKPQQAVLTMKADARIDPSGMPDLIKRYAGRLFVKPGETVRLTLRNGAAAAGTAGMLRETADLLAAVREELFTAGVPEGSDAAKP